jgi:hypothetical protein
MIDQAIVQKMLRAGKANDLLDLMSGESKYTSDNSELILNNLEEKKAWRMSLEHVKFVAKYGLDVDKVEEGSKFYSAYPDDFEKWLGLGAPGLVEEDLNNYLRDNPI